MNRKGVLRLAAVLLLMTAIGTAAVATAPTSMHYGAMWPVGLASGALLLTPRTLGPYVAVVVALLAALSFALGGYPLDVSLGFGLACALESWVILQVLGTPWTGRIPLRNNGDYVRFIAACHAGAAVGALGFMSVSALTSFGTPWKVGAATAVTHLPAQLILLGLFAHNSHHLGEYGRTERWLAWINAVGITTLAFVPLEMPVLAFLVIPGIGWISLRAPLREVTLQLVVVSGIASTLSVLDRGPFADPDLTHTIDPEFRWLALQVFLIVCATMTLAFSTAVGAQRWSANEAQVERARSERLVQSARGIAIIGTDEFGRINLFNPGAETILGYTAEEIAGHSTRVFHTAAEINRQAELLGCGASYLEVVRATVQLPPGTAREWEFIRKDGSPRWLSTILSPVRDENGSFVGYVATADDVTDRRNTQRALEAALANERTAVERLTAVDQVKDQFVSSVSHELRTPITNIVGYLELLMDGAYGEPTDEQSRAMTRIETNSRRLLTLIDDLLTLSSMETLNQPAELAPVDLGTVLRRADEIVRPSLIHRDLRVELEVPESPVMIYGDAGQLERLVINLATNAVKFTLDGGRVTLRLLGVANGTGPVIEVEDTGIGIPEADQEMLFNRFFRATQARQAAVQGSGLGLSIAKSIAELHGGRISATSVYGSGSTFRVEFPSPGAVLAS
ncbi:MAG TPA: ATP-binding protein [Marmoricola sp.]|nr:ATP-binding protein [Marmoricola sp.]